jgi:hypothetical protein
MYAIIRMDEVEYSVYKAHGFHSVLLKIEVSKNIHYKFP